MLRDESTLLDIAAACDSIREFTKGMDQKVFMADAKTQAAVLHEIMIIGEAVRRLSQDFRDRHSGIPWPEIAGMRNALIHAYDRVDLDEVWRVSQADVPQLRTAIAPFMPSEP